VSSGLGALSGFPQALRDRFLDSQLTRAALAGLMVELVNAVERGRHAKSGWPESAYNISKAALNALVRVLAHELGTRARVNAVSPGWARTDMGGKGAPRSVEEGAASIVAAAMLDDSTTGGNFQDGTAIAW
jgi:NAD(P)-dependent dehydrogenase (short-subunit alcohol dehydrogenase family)